MIDTFGAAWPSQPVPQFLTELIGRDNEITDILGLLSSDRQRLVTITGPAGVGKTRLAATIAHRIAPRFNHRVVFVSLATIAQSEQVLPAISHAFGLQVTSVEDILAALPELLDHDIALLVLDNMEHVTAAAGAIADLLLASPSLTVLATSQVSLGIPGEQLYPLQPLGLAAPGDATGAIAATEAVALFEARARAVRPQFAITPESAPLVADICRRLDGLPLAIELAAARTSILSLQALQARLTNRLHVLRDDRHAASDRQRTMQHAIGWSYGLLDAEEQAAFRQLTLFAGGFPLEAAEFVLEAESGDRDASELLQALVDRSLVQPQSQPGGDLRFVMLETMRSYGLEQLTDADEQAMRAARHAAWVTSLIEAAEPHFIAEDQDTWFNRLDHEWENIRVACERALANRQAETVFRIASAGWRFFATRGLVSEPRVWLTQALSIPAEHAPLTHVRALIAAGYLAEDQRDLVPSEAYLTEARDRLIQANLPNSDAMMSEILIGLGTVSHDRGEYEVAKTFHATAGEHARLAGNPRSQAMAMGNLATVAFFQGNVEEAYALFEDACQFLRTAGDHRAYAAALSNLGAVAITLCNWNLARQHSEQSLALQREMNDVRSMPVSLANLGEAHLHLGDLALAESYLVEAVSGFAACGDQNSAGQVRHGLAQIAMQQGNRVAAAQRISQGADEVMIVGDPYAMAKYAELLALLCLDLEQRSNAAALYVDASQVRASIGARPTPSELDGITRLQTEFGAANPEPGAGFDLPAIAARIDRIARGIASGLEVAPEVAITPGDPVEVVPEVVPDTFGLTRREREILGLLAAGETTQGVADRLFISPRTASTHVTNILAKFEVNSRTAAVAIAMRAGIV